MHLLNTERLVFKIFSGLGKDTLREKIPRYAVLSHRWDNEEGEVTYHDFSKGLRFCETKKGWTKVRNFCDLASKNDYEYAWLNTCCIDKSSSAELQEAINSMYAWYEHARICYVYLSDINGGSREQL